MRFLVGLIALLAFAVQPAEAQLRVPGAPSIGGRGVWTPVSAIIAPVTAISGPSLQLGTETAGTGYAEGWTATYNGTPALNPLTTFTASRQGFDTTGAATSYTDTFTATMAIRAAYPTSTASSYVRRGDNLVALSDYVYATDTPQAGITNNSTITSPKGICNWSMPSRTVIDGSLYLEAVCFHRNARNGSPVAAVIFRAADVGAAHTATCTSSTPYVSTLLSGQTNSDRNAVIVYGCTINTSALNAGLVTANAKAYPWIGDATNSVLDSADLSVEREFSPRYFRRDATRAATPAIAYVCATTTSCPAQITPTAGVTAGAWSTSAATALATPFDTIQNAITGATTAGANTTATGGILDGAIIRVGSGNYPLVSPSTARAQNIAALTITRDPALANQTLAVVQLTAAWRQAIGGRAGASLTLTSPITEAAVIFKDISFQRVGNFQIGAAADPGVQLFWQDVAFDNASAAGTWLGTGSANYFFGTSFSNLSGSGPLAGNTVQRIIRGAKNYNTALYTVELWNVLGSSFSNAQLQAVGTANRSIVAFNDFHTSATPTGDVYNVGFGEDLPQGAALVQNLFETGHTNAASPSTGISRDEPATGNVTNFIDWQNTFAGWGIGAGRRNMLYDSTVSSNRRHRLISWVGNLTTAVFTKADFVASATSTSDAPNHTGNFAFLYGAGVVGHYARFVDTGNGGVGQNADRMFIYPGKNAVVGTSLTTDTVDPLFTTFKATTWNGSALVAGTMTSTSFGDYHVGTSSPCKAKVPVAVLPAGLDGAARPSTNDACGAYP